MPDPHTRQRTIADLTVRIRRDLCIGSGNCVKVAPQVFTLDDEQIVDFRQPLQPAQRDHVIDACDVCPVDALFALDKNGDQIVP